MLHGHLATAHATHDQALEKGGSFSGDASIQLDVECIEAELKDLGPEWRTRSKPVHPGEEPDASSKPGADSAPGAGGS
jgi:hypothetical protein